MQKQDHRTISRTAGIHAANAPTLVITRLKSLAPAQSADSAAVANVAAPGLTKLPAAFCSCYAQDYTKAFVAKPNNTTLYESNLGVAAVQACRAADGG